MPEAISPDYQKAEESARALLEKYSINEPVVRVFDIAQKEGLKIQLFDMPEKLSNIAGFFDPDTKTIYVNNSDPTNRQTFTVAHELAHFILNHAPDKIGVLPRWPDLQNQIKTPVEQEANCFAAELLVPKKMLTEQMEKYSLQKEDVDLLARLFGVSQETMSHRLKRV